jgi:hypothetical protein
MKTRDELKSAWFIIKILVNEENTLKACLGTKVSDLSIEGTNPAGFNKLIPV